MTATLIRPTTDRWSSTPPAGLDRPLPTIDDVTRRELLKGAAALLVVAGCGADRQPAAAPSPEATTRIIEHKYGTIEIAGITERVVTVGFGEQDFVLALGVAPVGVREWLGPYPFETRPWAPDDIGDDQPETAGAEELDFEQIAALRPDLILGVYSFMTEDVYATLSQIAPTVAQSGEFADGGVPWQEQLRVTGRALGREQPAEDLVAEVEARFAVAREEHPEFEGKTAAVALAQDDGYYILEPQDVRMRFFGALGFQTPDETGPISGEQVDVLDQDVLVVFAEREDVENDALYRRLDAVGEGRVVYIPLADDLAGAIGAGSPLSLPFALDEAVPRLAAAVDGDPATEPAPTAL